VEDNAPMPAIMAGKPGSWGQVAPFVQRLPSLSAGQRAAAVNLGIFPDTGETSYASSTAPAPSRDRLADLEVLLRASPPQAAAQSAAKPVQVAYARPTRIVPSFQPKIWLQLASGADDS